MAPAWTGVARRRVETGMISSLPARLVSGAFQALVVLALAATSAGAQAVRGQLLDAERGVPLPGARLLLVTEAGAVLDSTVSDGQGRYRLEAPEPGSYALYFDMDGWAGVPSDQLQLKQGATTVFDFRVPLLSDAESSRISDIITADRRLQRPLPELCGEPVRAWEAGLLVGVVRERGSDRPVAGARIGVAGGGGTRETVSNDRGIYVLCNVMAGSAVKIVVTGPQGVSETVTVEVRAGTVGWYDLYAAGRR